MKTIVFILVSLDPKVGKVNVPALKKEIVKYVGTRMLAEDLDDTEYCPGIMLNDVLSDDDKKALATLMGEDGPMKAGLVFIELTDEEYETIEKVDYFNCIAK